MQYPLGGTNLQSPAQPKPDTTRTRSQATRKPPPGGPVVLHNVVNNFMQSGLLDTIPAPDFESIYVLSVQTGQKTAGTFHKELHEINKDISFYSIDRSEFNDDNSDVDFYNPGDQVGEYDDNNTIFSSNSDKNSSMIQPNSGDLPIIVNRNATLNGNLNINQNDPSFNLLFSKGFRSYAKIYNVLNQAKVPLYMYDKIIQTIGKEIVSKQFDPLDPYFTRKRFLSEISNRFKTPQPQAIPVHLDSRWNDHVHSGERQARDSTEVIVFDFKEQLIDLLSDHHLFGNMENLVVNKNQYDDMENKWKPYENHNSHIFEVMDGEWYQQYAKKQVIDYTTEFCFPIGLYIDASETVVYQRYSFQPLIMFPLILSNKARNKNVSSRVIALIPDLEARSSAVKVASKSGGEKYKGLSIRNYHKCLNVALQSLKECQQSGGVTTFLRLGNDVRHLQLKVPVAFILGDAKSQDHLSGRYGGHNTARMCRACNISFKNADDTMHECQWIQHNQFLSNVILALDEDVERKDPIKRNAYKSLHEQSQHAVLNAFQDVDFAGFPRGIFGCTPHDLMHAFLEGVLKYCTRIFIAGFRAAVQAEIDLCVDRLFCNFHSSESKNMLRTNFTKGMTNLTMITADEEAGMALTLLIVAQTNVGQVILDKRNSNDDEVDELGGCSFQNFVELIESLLAFHAWYKSTKKIPWKADSKSILTESIRMMLNKVKNTLPRTEGNGWKIQKFHELMHIPTDVCNFGSPKNFDTGIMENRLIYVGKINAKTTLKRGPQIFTRQLGDRIYHQQCFQKAKRCLDIIDDESETDNDDENSTNSTISNITVPNIQNSLLAQSKPSYVVRNVGNGHCTFKWLTKTINSIPDTICNRMGEIIKEYGLSNLEVYTEIKHLGKIYRAHPNYRSQGVWYDWAMIKYDLSNDDILRKEKNRKEGITPAYPCGHYPAKVLGFFMLEGLLQCLIHSCESKTSSKEDSCLTERWYLEYELKNATNRAASNVLLPKLRVCEVACIADRVYVVEESPGHHETKANHSSLVVLVKKREMWIPYFTQID